MKICPACGYDLRGGPAVDRVCPECGVSWVAPDAQALRQARKRAMWTMESLPTVIVVYFMLAVTIWLLAIYASLPRRLGPTGRMAAAAIPTVVWLVLVFQYGERTGWRRGSGGVLALFHLTGLLGTAAVLGVFVGCIYLRDIFKHQHGFAEFRRGWPWVGAGGLVLAILVLAVAIPRLQRVIRLRQRRLERKLCWQTAQRIMAK